MRFKLHFKKGSSLLEILIYITLVALLSSLIFPFVLRHYGIISSCAKNTSSFFSLACASDLIGRDICCAPADLKNWKEIKENSFLWLEKDLEVGWCCKKNKFIRSNKRYDRRKGKRIKTSSCAALGIKKVEFIYDIDEKEEEIKMVAWKIYSKGLIENGRQWLKNGKM